MVLKILLGLIGLGIVVFVHELGHFMAAKLVGIQVDVFSLGWGKKLVAFKRKKTEYRISWIPVGGYCKMKGDDSLKKAWESGSDTIEKEEGSMYGVSPWKRMVVVLMGPLFNLLFAILVLSVVWFAGITIRTTGNRIILASDYVMQAKQQTFPADIAGLKTGDRIIEIQGKKTEHWRDIQEAIAVSARKEIQLKVQAEDGSIRILKITPELDRETGAGRIGVYSWIEPYIETVAKDSSAAIAGLKSGDLITSIDGMPVRHTLDLMKAFENRNPAHTVTVARGTETISTELVLHYSKDGAPELGVTFKPLLFRSPRISVGTALVKGAKETFSTLDLTIKSIGLLFSGVKLGSAVSGPIRITYYVGEVATQGFKFGIGEGLSSIFSFLSLLSVSLFFMNLLPIPALDGGLFLLYLIEMITGKILRPKLIYRYQIVGIAIILGILVFSTLGDILFLFKR